MIGKTLKKIRKDKNIPIQFICDGIMDPGNYWRLENGQIESSFSTVLKLLERMNLSIEEFAEEFPLNSNSHKIHETELVTFFKNKDLQKLKALKERIADDLKRNKTMKLTHLYYLTDIYIAKIDENWDAQVSSEQLKKYLAKSNNWNSYELALLNNILFIYELDVSYLFYKTAVSKYSQINKEKMIPLTLNMMALAIQHNDKEKLIYILSILETIELDEKSSYERLTQKWGIQIANYYLSKDSIYLLKAEKIVDIFLQIDMKDTHHLYQSWTATYKKIIEQ